MSIIVCGDDYRQSDIGLFCKRIQKWRSDSSCDESVHYLNAMSSEKVKPGTRARNVKVVTNIGNNIYFPMVIYKAIVSCRSIDSDKASTSLNTVPGCIIHDVNLEYAAHIIAKSVADGVLCEDFNSVKDKISYPILMSVYDWLVPDHLKDEFLHSCYSLRGYFLLKMVLQRHGFIVCHSEYAISIVSKFIGELGLNKLVQKINLAYDVPSTGASVTRCTSTNGVIQVLLFGMAFSAAKALNLLVETLKIVAIDRPVVLNIAGKIDNILIDGIVDELTDAEDIEVRVHGFVTTDSLINLVSQSHYAWAYRVPTHGESSGTVLRAMSFGCCPIVADHGWYSELPDDLSLKVPPDSEASLIAKQILCNHYNSAENRDKRAEYVANYHSPKAYTEVLLSTSDRLGSFKPCEIETNHNKSCSPLIFDTRLGYSGRNLSSLIINSGSYTDSQANRYSDDMVDETCLPLLAAYSSSFMLSSDSNLLRMLSLCISPNIVLTENSKNCWFSFESKIEFLYGAYKTSIDNPHLEPEKWANGVRRKLELAHQNDYSEIKSIIDKYLIIVDKLFHDSSQFHVYPSSKGLAIFFFIVNAISLDVASYCSNFSYLEETNDKVGYQWGEVSSRIFLQIMSYRELYPRESQIYQIFPEIVHRAYILGQSVATVKH